MTMVLADKYTIKFNPDNVSIEVTKGENLLRAANAAGAHINATGRSAIESSVEIEIPPESLLHREFLEKKQGESATGRLVTPIYRESLISEWFFNPTIKKKYIEVDQPTIFNDLSKNHRQVVIDNEAVKIVDALVSTVLGYT